MHRIVIEAPTTLPVREVVEPPERLNGPPLLKHHDHSMSEATDLIRSHQSPCMRMQLIELCLLLLSDFTMTVSDPSSRERYSVVV